MLDFLKNNNICTPNHVRCTTIHMQYFCSFLAAVKNLKDVNLLYNHSNLTIRVILYAANIQVHIYCIQNNEK
jgi:hypothetical protein